MKPKITKCPHCEKRLPDKFLVSAAAGIYARRNLRAGRPRQLTPCCWCHQDFAAATLKVHQVVCSKRRDGVRPCRYCGAVIATPQAGVRFRYLQELRDHETSCQGKQLYLQDRQQWLDGFSSRKKT